jgi:uncharacterized protein involved in exopolysaccharide biosynthesis
MSNTEDFGLSPINYLKVFFRRKEFILIPAFIGLVLGVCTGILLPKQYKSSTVIMVEEGKSDNPLFDKLAVSTTAQQRLTTIKESILGWNNLVEVVKKLEMDKDVKTKMEFEKLIGGVRKNIKIGLKGGNIFNLTYVDKTPEITQAIVKTITDSFIDKNVQAQNRETSDAITFIEEQLHVYQGKIKSAEIAKMQDRLNTLLLDSTEKHPLVKELQEQIAAQKAELKKGNLEYTEGTGLNVRQTKPMIDEIKKALDTLEGKSRDQVETTSSDSKLLVNVDLEKVLARDVSVNEDIYNMLLQRLETAKITQRLQSSKEGTRYTVLDPARVPLEPFKPNRAFAALVGLFVGAMAGVGLIFASEFLDKSFIDVEDAKEYLGVALFGAISKINTPESIRREKEQKRWLYGLTFVIGVIMVVITVKINDFLM